MSRALRALMLAPFVLAACDRGPSGPGSLAASVEGDVAVGIAVVEVRGAGITGFGGAADSETFSVELQTGVHRVLVLSRTSRVDFQIQVEELRDHGVTAVVLSAAGPDNVPLPATSSLRVVVRD